MKRIDVKLTAMTQEEIAKALGISVRQVKRLEASAMKKLRAALLG
jgi:DNA-directed RNA polymerase specialized sigma subunit